VSLLSPNQQLGPREPLSLGPGSIEHYLIMPPELLKESDRWLQLKLPPHERHRSFNDLLNAATPINCIKQLLFQ
jgi:hypothetical protein